MSHATSTRLGSCGLMVGTKSAAPPPGPTSWKCAVSVVRGEAGKGASENATKGKIRLGRTSAVSEARERMPTIVASRLLLKRDAKRTNEDNKRPNGKGRSQHYALGRA